MYLVSIVLNIYTDNEHYDGVSFPHKAEQVVRTISPMGCTSGGEPGTGGLTVDEAELGRGRLSLCKARKLRKPGAAEEVGCSHFLG